MDQLHSLGHVTHRRMFGAYGLYRKEIFFGIVFEGRLYFKTDEKTRREYVECGMEPFRPNPRQTLKTYYEVPVDVLEDDRTLVQWAETAVRCQDAGARSKPGRKRER